MKQIMLKYLHLIKSYSQKKQHEQYNGSLSHLLLRVPLHGRKSITSRTKITQTLVMPLMQTNSCVETQSVSGTK